MAVAAIPGFVTPRLSRLRRKGRELAARLLTPARPVLANLAAIPFTVAGWGCIATAVFTWNTTAGLGALGVILMVLEHQIADET